jgi:hypothetical protein
MLYERKMQSFCNVKAGGKYSNKCAVKSLYAFNTCLLSAIETRV